MCVSTKEPASFRVALVLHIGTYIATTKSYSEQARILIEKQSICDNYCRQHHFAVLLCLFRSSIAHSDARGPLYRFILTRQSSESASLEPSPNDAQYSF